MRRLAEPNAQRVVRGDASGWAINDPLIRNDNARRKAVRCCKKQGVQFFRSLPLRFSARPSDSTRRTRSTPFKRSSSSRGMRDMGSITRSHRHAYMLDALASAHYSVTPVPVIAEHAHIDFHRSIRQHGCIHAHSAKVLHMTAVLEGFPQRLRELRKRKDLSQTELGLLAGLHYTHIGRFERGTSRPSGDTLKRLADALDVTSDYLLDGAIGVAAKARFEDRELLRQFQEVERLPDEDNHVVKKLLDAFLTKKQLQALMRG